MRNLDKRVNNTYYTPNSNSANCTISIGRYLTDIAKYKVLSEEEIKTLLRKAKNNDSKAITKIVNSNQRFVFALAKRFSDGDMDLLSDLINEANIGLIKSISRFNESNNNKFLTYSVYWMQRQIFLYLTFTHPIIKVSNKAKTTKISDIKNKFLISNGRYPTPEEIVDELYQKYGIEIIDESDVYQLATSSIDGDLCGEVHDDFSSYYYDSNEKVITQNIFNDEIENNYSKTLISNSIGVLTPKEKKVVELLYGITDYREYEVQEVAMKLGMSKEGVRLINKRALEKLKSEIIIKRELI